MSDLEQRLRSPRKRTGHISPTGHASPTGHISPTGHTSPTGHISSMDTHRTQTHLTHGTHLTHRTRLTHGRHRMSADVIVVGAGVAGASTAFHLSRLGPVTSSWWTAARPGRG